jgi:hypothetical protein
MVRACYEARVLGRVALLVGWCLGAAASPTAALAQGADRRTARLAYVTDPGAEGCPSEPEFRARVAARLGYAPFEDRSERLVTVRLSPAGEGLEGRVGVRNAAEENDRVRTFDVPERNCEELARSVVLAVSIAIDPTSLGGASSTLAGPPESSPAEPAEPPTSDLDPEYARPQPATAAATSPVSPAAPPRPEPATPHADPAVPGMWLALTGSLGAGPDLATVGTGVGFELRWRHASASLAARVDLPRQQAAGGGEIEGHLIFAELAVCARFAPVLACGLAGAGAMRVAGRDLVDAQEVFLAHVALGARGGLEIELLEELSLRALLDLWVPLTPAEVRVGATTAWVMPPLHGTLAVALAAHFS